MSVGEESSPVEVTQIFLEATQGPRAVRPEPEDLPPYLAGLVSELMRLWEQVWTVSRS